jgi:hypothetical protein
VPEIDVARPPAPLIYWLWVAGNQDLAGAAPARRELGSLEAILLALQHAQVVHGSWRSRVAKLRPPKGRAGKDHLTEFRSAQFELLLAFQLFCDETHVTLNPDGKTSSCDMTITTKGTNIAAVEAYAPQKDIDNWYERSVVTPWRELVGTSRPAQAWEPTRENLRNMFINPAAVPAALSNILTNGNFPEQKARQLTSGDVPTLLAIRAYSLTNRLENLLTIRSAETLAKEITAEAWACLPEQCAGLLLCFTSDIVSILGGGGPVFFLPAPNRTFDNNLMSYLRNIGAMTR